MAMDDGGTARQAAAKRRRRRTAPYMSQELIAWEILTRLPVKSLARFRCVCKAWRATISSDASFHRAHLRLQKSCLLVSPHTQEPYHLDEHLWPKHKVCLYRWEANQQQGTPAPLVHATDLISSDEMHGFAHCNGLVLLPAKAAVHVVNPATRRLLTLPWSPGAEPPCDAAFPRHSHQAFGLGHYNNTYKVARFFYRSVYKSGYRYSTGMEVFTIGTDQHWRETAKQPPYPVLVRRTATFFKGSLIWTVDECKLGNPAPGFLYFSLEDEVFGILLPPPRYPRLEYTKSSLGELHGELCLACPSADNDNLVELWMCDDLQNPRWDRRYTLIVSLFRPPHLCPIAVFDGLIVFKEWDFNIRHYDLTTKAFKEDVFRLGNLRRYHDPSTGSLAGFTYFDVIPYIPSLIPLPVLTMTRNRKHFYASRNCGVHHNNDLF